MGVLSLFEDGLAQVGLDGRISLWNCGSGNLEQSVQEKGRRGGNYTCVAYRACKRGAGVTRTLVCAGSATGRVVVWDLGSGKVLHKGLELPGSSAGQAVSDVCLSADCNSVFACNGAKYIYEFSLSDGEMVRKLKAGKPGPTKLCISSDGSMLLSANTDIIAWDIKSGEVVKRFAGHPTPVRSLAFSADGSYIVSCAEDRFVSLWNMDTKDGEPPSKKSKKSNDDAVLLQRTPTLVLSAPSSPTLLSAASTGGSQILVAAVCEDESASVWSANPSQASASSSKAQAPSTRLNPDGSAGVLAIFLDQGASKDDSKEIVIARNSPIRPVFHSVTIMENDEFVTRVDLTDISSKSRLVTKGGAEVTESKDGQTTEKDTASKSKEGKERLHVVAGANAAVPTPRSANAGDDKMETDEGEDDVTMGERIKALSDRLGKHIDESTKEVAAAKSKKRPRGEEAAATAGGMSTVLEQALQSNDNALLESCLNNQDKKTVDATVTRLSGKRAVLLLKTLVRKFQDKPTRGAELLVWIKAVLDKKSAALIKATQLSGALSGLYQIIEDRVAMFSKLQRLQGRLNFVISQVASRPSENQNETEESKGPAVVYDEQALASDDESEEDNSSNDEEDEESNAESGSDEEDAQDNEDSESEEETKAKENGVAHMSEDSGDDDDEVEEEEEEEKMQTPKKSPKKLTPRLTRSRARK
mmetsp:Transcript_21155/g.39331  ORF Transcript_21155/g.39331 Transcript_21155/m.39331 type:complete len:700 (+) Transcript_21155:128-2227(+)